MYWLEFASLTQREPKANAKSQNYLGRLKYVVGSITPLWLFIT